MVISAILAGVIVVAVIVVLVVTASSGSRSSGPPAAGSPAQLSLGQKVFSAHCAQCHGRSLEGGPMGPRVVSSEFAALPDASYRTAMASGVPNRRPEFGPMPPQAVTPTEADAVIAYIRSQQHAAGLV